MSLKHINEYRDPEIAKKLISEIHKVSKKEIIIMEVCGTHTMSIFRHGIRNVLPKTIKLISGPGCPVCVTSQPEIDAFIEIAGNENIVLTVFGDLMKVPGSTSSLYHEKAKGKDVRIVYSPLDCVLMAEKEKDKNFVFMGIGFETTNPTIAGAILTAHKLNLKNFFILPAQKTVPVALEALMQIDKIKVNAFLLPGHVLLISGTNEYEPFVQKYKIPAVVAGFEPIDILKAVLMLAIQFEKNEGRLENAYERAVTSEGNKKAKEIVNEVFEPSNAIWRGIGEIKGSGLKIKSKYKNFDAYLKFNIKVKEAKKPKGCICGNILTGIASPTDCKLYKTACNPMHPIGPCMVSSEGTCAAYFKYTK